ncbi:MAG: leucine-rich repeat protein [Bacteroidaceae bacterium]|nr:leucine-rich repeat protein [Bacteroidaceae bacterium]
MRKIFQYILMAVAVVATASCSNELDEALQPVGNGTLQFVVSDFPAFGEGPETRVIGTQDEGKTAWANGDQILVLLYSQKYGNQAVTLTYNADTWEPGKDTLSYLENETPTITAVYAPGCKISENNIVLNDNQVYGMSEYIHATTKIEGNTLRISFEGVDRNYSRLRIATMPEATLTVTTTGFTPAGATSEATAAYTLTTDNNGNAFLYGVFSEGATVSVNHGDVVLKDYAFTADAEKHPNGTEQGKSYALDARPIIDGAFGGKDTASEEEVAALVEQIKTYVDNGITTIIVTGEEPAMITITGTYSSYTITAIGEAIYRLSGSGYKDNSTYLGKIDLILPDVTEIVDYEFEKAYALNSITLPKVTKLGYSAFYDCQYLQKITFGSVVTEGTPNVKDFQYVGEAVGGCHLVLNSGQANAATEYLPEPNDKRWWAGTQWNYIELI